MDISVLNDAIEQLGPVATLLHEASPFIEFLTAMIALFTAIRVARSRR